MFTRIPRLMVTWQPLLRVHSLVGIVVELHIRFVALIMICLKIFIMLLLIRIVLTLRYASRVCDVLLRLC